MVMSSSTSSSVNQPLMVLELFIRVNQDDAGLNHSGKRIQRVVVELDREQARDLVSRLEGIQKEVVALSE